MSVIAPIVQKLTRFATAPKTKASAKASQATSAGRWLESGMAGDYRMRAGAAIPLNPDARPRSFTALTATFERQQEIR